MDPNNPLDRKRMALPPEVRLELARKHHLRKIVENLTKKKTEQMESPPPNETPVSENDVNPIGEIKN